MALELMNLKLTTVLGDVTSVTGLAILRSILKGQRDPVKLAALRDRRCKHSDAEIATDLDGRYRPEHVRELAVELDAVGEVPRGHWRSGCGDCR